MQIQLNAFPLVRGERSRRSRKTSGMSVVREEFLMREGVETMAMTYEISGVPWLAVRVGQRPRALGIALRAADRRATSSSSVAIEQLAYDAAVEARALGADVGMYHLLN